MRSRRRCSGSCMTSSRQHRSRPSVRLGRPARSARAVARSSRTGRRQGRLAGRRPGGRDRRLVGAVERRQIKLGDGVDHKPRTAPGRFPGQPDRLSHHPRPLQTVETVDSLSEKDIAAHSKPLALRSGVERDAVRTGDGGDGSRLRDDDANGQAKRITRKGPSRPWARLYPAVRLLRRSAPAAVRVLVRSAWMPRQMRANGGLADRHAGGDRPDFTRGG